MVEKLRLKKLIRWLIGQGIVSSQKELARKLGYAKSTFSLIVNEKIPISGKFINRLCEVDKRINRGWILNGEGEMLLQENTSNLSKEIFNIKIEEIRKPDEDMLLLIKTITEKDKEIDDLKIIIAILTDKVRELKSQIANVNRVQV